MITKTLPDTKGGLVCLVSVTPKNKTRRPVRLAGGQDAKNTPDFVACRRVLQDCSYWLSYKIISQCSSFGQLQPVEDYQGQLCVLQPEKDQSMMSAAGSFATTLCTQCSGQRQFMTITRKASEHC